MAFAVAFPATVDAVVVERLYEASVPVADQSAGARQAAMADALGVVLVRVTGQRDAPAFEEFSDLIVAAPRLVQQFRYEQREEPDAETGEPVRVPYLWVRFDARAVQRAAIERGVPVWGPERPAVLVWVAFDDGFERGLLDEDAAAGIVAALEAVAAQRGLPLVMPLMDLEDRVRLGFTDLWGGFEDRILEASARYQPNAILVGRLHRVEGDEWVARWSSFEDGARRYAETAPGPLDAVAGEGVHWLADGFGERFAVMPDALRDGRTRLVIDGVEGIGPYVAVYRYLESLSPVGAVALESIAGGSLIFALELRGTEQQLQQAIALGASLVPGEPLIAVDGSLRYRLRP